MARAMRPVAWRVTERRELTFPREPLRMSDAGRAIMNTTVRSILAELKSRLATLYGERLRGVYLNLREEAVPAEFLQTARRWLEDKA